MKRATLIVMVLVFGLAACKKDMGPKDVAEKFWDTMESGKIEDLKPYVTKASFETLQREESGKKEVKKGGEFKLGEAKIEGDKATVSTTLKDDETSLDLQTVIVREDGKWKVDLESTMMTMLGGAMGEMMKQIGEGMEAATEKMDEAMQELSKVEEKAVEATKPKVVEEKKSGNSFELDESVMVEWRGTWWPAKVIEVGKNRWKINYDGYNSSWDEWVGPDRIKKK